MKVTSMSVRWWGLIIAVAIAATWTLIPILLVVGVKGSVGTQVTKVVLTWLAPSIPVAGILGFALAPWAVTRRSVHRPALAMGALALIFGAPGVGIAIGLVDARNLSDVLQALGGGAALGFFGLLFLGWAYWPITVASGYIWSALVRSKVGVTT